MLNESSKRPETPGLARIVPTTGVIKDRRVAVYGENVKVKVLVFPTHKASTTTPCIFLETARKGNAPIAIMNVESKTMVSWAQSWLRFSATGNSNY